MEDTYSPDHVLLVLKKTVLQDDLVVLFSYLTIKGIAGELR